VWSRGHLHFTPGSPAPARLFVESKAGEVVLVAEVGRDEAGVFQPLLFSTTVVPSSSSTSSADADAPGGPSNATAPRECSCASRAQDYRGTNATAADGSACRPWEGTEFTEAQYPDRGLDGGHSYCRNPDGDARLWCFVEPAWSTEERSLTTWKYCNVPQCEARLCDPVSYDENTDYTACFKWSSDNPVQVTLCSRIRLYRVVEIAQRASCLCTSTPPLRHKGRQQ
jgi:hypothetical protein